MPTKGETRYDTCWRKSRIAARILLREEAGKLTRRDVALGRKLAADPDVTPRLIQQAIHEIKGAKTDRNANVEKQFDILVSRLQRFGERDVAAFQLAIAKTGHPTEEFTRRLQKSVDLYRPRFEEETWRSDMFAHTRQFWKILWNKEIDIHATIIRPALARAAHDL